MTGVNVTDGFFYEVDKEDATITTWSSELAVLKQDDGSYTSVSGIGDRAAQGAIKEFAAEADGYIVVVVNADVNVATASTFTRTKKDRKAAHQQALAPGRQSGPVVCLANRR